MALPSDEGSVLPLPVRRASSAEWPAGMPALLGSWWALIPALAAMLLMSMRTSLEDRTLQEELPGYREYVQSVRYRLLPGVW